MNNRSLSNFRTLLTGVAASAMMWGAASAQTKPEDSTTLVEVVVTAQKRGEKLLDVPVPVTAVEGASLTRQNLVKLTDFSPRIPGLAVAGPNVSQISLRGVNTGGATGPTVAVTIDDVPVGTSTRLASPFVDIDPSELARLEVLRGPQGTLYGAASLGGLIKIVTKDADPNNFSGRVELGYNEVHEGRQGSSERASVNVPLWKDKLAVRLSAFRRDDPAYLDDVNPQVNSKDVNKSRTQGTRAAVFFQPIEPLTINISRLKQTVVGQNDGRVEVNGYPTTYTPVRGYTTTNLGPSTSRTEVKLTQARVNYDFGFATLTSVSGWGKYSNFTDSDLTTTFPFVYNAVAGGPILPGSPAGSSVRLKDGGGVDKFTQEVRLASNPGGKLEWLVGAFYTDEDSFADQNLQGFGPTGALLSDIVRFPIPASYKDKAVFADATYKFTDQFDVQVGGRYGENKQTFRQDQIVNASAARFFGVTAVGTPRHSSEDAFTWLVSPRYKFNDDMMAYGRISTGFRAGGPNLPVAGAPDTFASDSVTNYEVGLKGYLFDRRVTIDTSLFDIEWKDVQLQNTAASNLTYLTNGGKARSRGLEVTGQWAPGSGWTISGNATYNVAELTQDIPLPATGAGVLGVKGTRLPFTPKFASNLGVEKSFAVFGDFKLTLGANWSHVGERSSLLRSSVAPVARRGAVYMPAYDVIDLNANLTDGDWDLSVYVRNLGSERGVRFQDDRQGAVLTNNVNFITPQIIGVSVARNF
jgi:outer membrane receptor protein involved in Fe transport